MKRAVIYYSLTDNTKEAAEFVARELDASLFCIELAKPMPETKAKQMFLGGMQASLGFTPEIKGVPQDLEAYEEIILGTPIWAGKEASPIHTLLKKYAIADRVYAVFTFSGGGDNEKCIASLSKTLVNLKCNVALADRAHESSSNNPQKLKQFVEDILAWQKNAK